MRGNRKKAVSLTAVVLCAALLLSGGALRADSMLGALHLGIPVSGADARGRALGGATSAITGEDFSFDNPARTVNFWRSGVSGTMSQDWRTLKAPDGTDKLSSTEFMALRAVFPGFEKLVFSWGIYQDRDLTWETSDRQRLDFLGGEAARTFSSVGNFYVSRLAVARPFGTHLAFGIAADWMIGKANRQRTLAFGNTNYINSVEVYRYNYSYVRPTLGVLTAFKGLNVGLAYTPSTSADVKKNVITQGGVSFAEVLSQDIASTLRFGASYHLTREHMISLDYEVQNWAGIQALPDPSVRSVDQKRLSIGYEMQPATGESSRYFRRIPMRVGYSRAIYPFELNGNPVRESFFSLGSGSYFGRNAGHVDVTLEVGSRKVDAPGYPQENVTRLVVSLSSFDRWVKRPKRK